MEVLVRSMLYEVGFLHVSEIGDKKRSIFGKGRTDETLFCRYRKSCPCYNNIRVKSLSKKIT